MIMFNRLFVKGILISLAFHPQVSSAEEFTGEIVLGWSEEAQDHFLATSITMTSIVVGRTGRHGDLESCMTDWYTEKDVRQERHIYIRKKLEAYPSYHPQGIILAVIEEACGSVSIN